jgi:hypothetical protein
MDLENLLPIVLAAIYILSRFFKAKPKQGKSQRPVTPQKANRPAAMDKKPSKKKAFTFEDILKEFEKNLAGEDIEEEKPLPVEDIEYERPKPVAVEAENHPSKYESYEGTSYETPEILKKDRNRKEEFSRSENYAVKEEEESDFIKMLREPDGAKNAIVLSEIINRKYF